MRRIRRAGYLAAAVLVCVLAVPCCIQEADAAVRILTLEGAKSLAIMHSMEYWKGKSSLSLAQIDYTEAVKSAALKKKNKRTFRWSPLLNFKFPEKPDLSEASEWMYQPLQAQNKIKSVRHRLEDIRYAADEEISNLYVDAYVMQETIAYTQERMEQLQEDVEKSRWKVYTGEALTQETEKMQAVLEKLAVDQAGYLRSYENIKSRISDRVGMDISTGWRFQEPFHEGKPDRSMLEDLKEYTLAMDHTYYEKKLDTSLGLLNLEINEGLIKAKYPKQMYLIQPYINQAKAGEALDGDAFKENYDLFLQEIDKKWNGNYEILFLKIPKEWMKGEVDGIRYVEDDPYVLYFLALEYADLKLEEEGAAKELEDAVGAQFEALILAANSQEGLKKELEGMEKELEKNAALHKAGKVTYEELASCQESYGQAELDVLNARGEYTKLWNSFHRLTCGGAGIWEEKGGFSPDAAAANDLAMPQEEGFWYYIESRMEDQMFVLRVSVPEDAKIKVTDYELWVDGIQVGERTDVEASLKHLTLAVSDVGQAVIRFYDGGTFVDECPMDPSASKGKLFVKGVKESTVNKKDGKIGACSIRHNPAALTAEFSITSVQDNRIAFYSLTDAGGRKLYQEEPLPVGRKLKYLSAAVKDVEELRVEFYDEKKKKCCTGRIHGHTMEIYAED